MKVFEYGKAICYSGYRLGQSPKTEIPTKEQIKEDLEILLADGFRYLRMYDPNLHAERVLEIIRENNLPMKCMVGVDYDNEVNNYECSFEEQNFSEEELAAHIARNDAEVEKLIDMVKRYPDEIIAISVGNENTPCWGAHMVPLERLIKHAKRLKEATDKPLTFCEGAGEWEHLEELAKYLDIISVHSYPLHMGFPVEEAVKLNAEHYKQVQEWYPDKEVIFTEIGWSSRPAVHMVAEYASEEAQARYYKEVSEWLEQEQIVGFLFEAFDEPWKGSRLESSECNWGLYYENRTLKPLIKKVREQWGN